MSRRSAAAAGALALGLAAAAAARAEPSDERAAVALAVPLDRTAVEVLSEFAAAACERAAADGAEAAPGVRAASESPSALERALVSATEARVRTNAPDARPHAGPNLCLLRAQRREAALSLEVCARDARGMIVPATAVVPWDAELAAISGDARPIAERDVRATSAPLEGRGYVAVAATRAPETGALLFAVRAEGVDVHAIALDARGRVRASRLASSERPAGVRAPGSPRRPLATTDVRGDDLEVAWADLRDPYAVSIDEGSLRFTPLARCAPRGHRTFGVCALRVAGRDYFSGRLLRGELVETLPSAFYVRVEAPIRGADGVARRVSALTTAGGRLRVTVRPHDEIAPSRRSRRRSAGVPGHGLAVSVADVDLDGEAELLTSSDRPSGEGDRLTLYRVRSVGTVLRLWRSAELSGSVTVAAAADLDGDGREELLAIEEPPTAAGEARLWVVR